MNDILAKRYRTVLDRAAELADLESACALLAWDQETLMPKPGVSGRAAVLGTLAGLIHERFTAPALAEDIAVLERESSALDDLAAAQVREFARTQRRLLRIPAELVKAMAQTQSKATAVWAQARADKDFASFAPLLEQIYRLKREIAEAVGYEDDIYDALLDEYEPGTKTKEMAAILEDVREFLVPVVARIAERPAPDSAFTAGPFAAGAQDHLGRELVTALGFDLGAGRLDISEHPFSSGIHGGDTRLTTHYKPDLTVGLFGTLHEAGHGLYEQNLAAEYRRTPVGPAASLGMHESQSRLWENLVGRSRDFWAAHYGKAQDAFPKELGPVSLDRFYRAINKVEPSLVRIEADEVTYNLHIVLRFELERELLTGRLKVQNLPEAWNSKVKKYLGLTPPGPEVGVLQDIHWAAGYVGYFPTYTLGNVYASQLYAAAERAIPDLSARIRRGDLLTLRDWLIENVHRHGRRYPAPELVRRATGKEPSTADFKNYIRTKFGELYGF